MKELLNNALNKGNDMDRTLNLYGKCAFMKPDDFSEEFLACCRIMSKGNKIDILRLATSLGMFPRSTTSKKDLILAIRARIISRRGAYLRAEMI